jgi:flagellar motor switch protein FliG
MGNKKDIVVTAYGHSKTIDRIAVSLFEISESSYYDNQDAQTYCNAINSLELKDDSWVFAKILTENSQYPLGVFLPLEFSDVIIQLDNIAVQKVLREIDSSELVKSLKDQDEAVKEKIFTNVSKRAAQMLKEDMECIGPIGIIDVKETQKKILSIICYLESTGEIVIPQYKGELIK